MKYPNLEIIDRAIELLKTRRTGFSCHALGYAVDFSSWGKSRLSIRRQTNRYQDQYQRFTRQDHGGWTPKWWDKIGNTYLQREEFRRSRIRALKRFRKACIDAAKASQ